MIVRIEQKEYSTKTLKLVRALKGAGNRLSTSINNAGLKVGDTLQGGRKLGGPAFKFKPKTSTQLNRETLELRNSVNQTVDAAKHPIRTAAPTIIKAENAMKTLATNPGSVVDRGIEASIRNPIAVGGNVGSKVLMVTNPETAALPLGAMSIGAEKAVKKAVPQYARVTEKAANGYKRSRLSGLVRGGVNSAYQVMGGMPIL